MKCFNKSWLLIAITIASISCQSKSQQQLKWEKDMEISCYEGGGMVPESKTVMIKDGKGKYIHWLQAKSDSLSFTLSQQELDELMKQINTTNFRSIESGETGSIAYDKETTSVTFISNGKKQQVSVGATEGITKGKAEGFFNLYNYILALAMKKTGQAQ